MIFLATFLPFGEDTIRTIPAVTPRTAPTFVQSSLLYVSALSERSCEYLISTLFIAAIFSLVVKSSAVAISSIFLSYSLLGANEMILPISDDISVAFDTVSYRYFTISALLSIASLLRFVIVFFHERPYNINAVFKYTVIIHQGGFIITEKKLRTLYNKLQVLICFALLKALPSFLKYFSDYLHSAVHKAVKISLIMHFDHP